MRILIVHNPRSGHGSDGIFMFERELLEEYDECVTRILGESTSLGELLFDAESFDLVVISGGDGTISSALYELRGRGVKTCVFPSGTANLFCVNLGCSFEPSALARACKDGRCAALDVGEVRWYDHRGNSQVRGFAMMAGLGYDAEIMRKAEADKEFLGEAAYYWAAINKADAKPLHFQVTADGQQLEKEALCCLIANNAMLQGELEIVPDCRMDDGLLDVIFAESKEPVGLLAPLASIIFNPKASRPEISSIQATRVEVKLPVPGPLEIDGEVVAERVLRCEAQIYPAAVPVICDAVSRY